MYLFKNQKGDTLYIGKASNLKKRVASYFQEGLVPDSKTNLLISQVKSIETIAVGSEIEAFLLEASLIKKHNPKYNVRLTDGKSYILLRISIKDDMPKIQFSRSEADRKSVYFGPYPSFPTLRLVLKIIRRIFPFQSANHQGKRICLYHHLGLCPCPVTLDTQEKRRGYRRDILRIVKFLNSRVGDVVTDLEKERNVFSKALNFEKASEIQKQIEAVRTVTAPFYKPFEFESNPLLKDQIRSEEISALRKYLNENGVKTNDLHRIECFDISNTSGTNATGSMVTFVNGERDTSFYRRFKIKKTPDKIPNDYEMMKEVIRRRFTHLADWGIPDLIIVDGGKGQVSSVQSILSKQNIKIPLIGLAKREELIVTEDLRMLRLQRSSHTLSLVRRIRDEAHRFAINYHKKLRSRATYA